MADWIKKSKTYLLHRGFVTSTVIGVLFLTVSIVVNYFAALYAVERGSNSVTDLILSNIPVVDVAGIFVYAPLVLLLFVVVLLCIQQRYIPFVLKAVSLFVLIRAFFVILTHIGPFPTLISVDEFNLGRLFNIGEADLFFSGHTGMPFLLGLIFWENRFLRFVFLATSVLFGVVVLLGHLHYSIDVLSAFFITYSIFHIAQVFFKKDWHIARHDVGEVSSTSQVPQP